MGPYFAVDMWRSGGPLVFANLVASNTVSFDSVVYTVPCYDGLTVACGCSVTCSIVSELFLIIVHGFIRNCLHMISLS